MKKIIIMLLALLLISNIAYAQRTVSIPIFGELSLDLPLPLIGIILGLVDGGLNPCALSVLFFLIAYLMAIGSKKKCLIIGFTYSFMVFLTYFLFMYGALNVFSIIGYIETVKMIVASFILIAGFLEIKDFFFYGRWVSLEIPKFAKPTIEKLVKSSTILSAILLGLFVSLVEIPCAGVFPFIYITILAERTTTMLENIFYLLYYNFFFVLPLVFLTLIFYLGFLEIEKAEKTRVRLRRHMRLIAGLIMLLLGSLMLLRVI
jgi:cytochrome c biogenesis protein CcdA